jgi:hypothetical protein
MAGMFSSWFSFFPFFSENLKTGQQLHPEGQI